MQDTEHNAVRIFAGVLGWDPPHLHKHSVPPDNPEQREEVIVWYESGSAEEAFLQVNTRPPFMACVFAPRYGLETGWHFVDLACDKSHIEMQARRLAHWLHRDWFRSIQGRQEFCRKHPECKNNK